MWDDYLGHVNVANRCLKLRQLETAPVSLVPFRAGSETREAEKAKINEVLAENILIPAQAWWAVPIVFVLKKDRTFHLCTYYNKLTAVAQLDSNIIPRMDEHIDSLGKPAVFLTLDGSTDRWKMEIEDADNF